MTQFLGSRSEKVGGALGFVNHAEVGWGTVSSGLTTNIIQIRWHVAQGRVSITDWAIRTASYDGGVQKYKETLGKLRDF